MALSQVSVALTQIDEQRTGYISVSLSNYNNTGSPEITEGSVIELNGDLYRATANQAIAGWAGIGATTQAYIYIDNAGAPNYTTTLPTWNTTKQGFYNGTNRYIAQVYKVDAATYSNKRMYINRAIGYNANLSVYNSNTEVEIASLEKDTPGLLLGDEFEIKKPISCYMVCNEVLSVIHVLTLHSNPYPNNGTFIRQYFANAAISTNNNPYGIMLNPGVYWLSLAKASGGSITTISNKLIATGVYGTNILDSIRVTT